MSENSEILIEEIEGINPATIKRFKDAGIISVNDLANADELDLAIDINISEETATTFIKAAQKLLDERMDVQKLLDERRGQQGGHSYEFPDEEKDSDYDIKDQSEKVVTEENRTVLLPLKGKYLIEEDMKPYIKKIREDITRVEEEGIIEPIIVRPIGDDKYEIISGNRRFNWAKVAELEDIPVIVINGITDNQVRILQFHEALNPSATEMKDFEERVEELYRGLKVKHKCTKEWVREQLKKLEGGNKSEETGTWLESELIVRAKDIESRRFGGNGKGARL